MKKNIGAQLALYPCPVIVVGAMVNGKPTWTLVAHAGTIAHSHLMVSFVHAHYINQGIIENKMISVNVVDESWLKEADRMGVVSGNKENSRMELLVEFKVSYGNAMKTVMAMLAKFRKDMDIEKRQEFVYSFFPFMFGIYPYTIVTEKQKEAMKLACVNYTYSSLHNLTFVAARRMLKN